MIVAASGSPLWRAGRSLLALGALGVAWAGWSRFPRWGRALGLLVGGILGSVCGIALGVLGVVKSGAAVPTLGGLLALAGGLALLALSTVQLLHALHGPWKLAALVIAYLVAQLAILPLAVGVYAANPPAGHVSSGALRSSGLVARVVHFRSSDGVRLAGWYVPPHNGAVVVVVPGSGSTRAAVVGQGAVLARHGYGVLLVDNRGHGGSGGSAMDFGWWGEHDLAGAVTFLTQRPGVDRGRIALLGESMGGEEAIGAIGADARVRAVVAEGVTGRSASDLVTAGASPATLIEHLDAIVSHATAGLLSGAPEPATVGDSIAAARPRPILLIAGHDERAFTRALGARRLANLTIWQTDAAHTAALASDPASWARRVLGFLDGALGTSGH